MASEGMDIRVSWETSTIFNLYDLSPLKHLYGDPEVAKSRSIASKNRQANNLPHPAFQALRQNCYDVCANKRPYLEAWKSSQEGIHEIPQAWPNRF
jgi:hypothetical protein